MNSPDGSRSSLDSFDPETDPSIRKWAARTGLKPGEPSVIMTAAIEFFVTTVIQRISLLESKFEANQQLWGTSFSQNNQTLRQALELIQQQQSNQTLLTKTYDELTKSLQRFDQRLNLLEAKINALPNFSKDLTQTLIVDANWSLSLRELKVEVLALRSDLTESLNQAVDHLIQIKSDDRAIGAGIGKPRARAIVVLLFLLVATAWGGSWYGRKQAVNQFGGESNFDFWRRVRVGNLERTKDCTNKNAASCQMQLPR